MDFPWEKEEIFFISTDVQRIIIYLRYALIQTAGYEQRRALMILDTKSK